MIDNAAGITLLVLLSVMIANQRQGTLGAWFKAKFLGYGDRPDVAATATATAGDVGAVTGADIAQVDGITGGVHKSVADNVRRMIAAAAAAGITLRGGGYRTHQQQVDLHNQKPALAAKPGTSMHEKGLAIDFEGCSSRSTPTYRWLAANAARYGFQNLRSSTKDEPWHWSTNGR